MTETEIQLQRVMEDLAITRVILYIAIVGVIIAGIMMLFLHRKLREDGMYEWYNPETGWLNRTHFIAVPKRNQIFWADEAFWMITDINVKKQQLRVVAIDDDDILQPVPPTEKGENYVG